LQHLEEDDPDAIKGTTVFYFMDNSTTYWISASGSSKNPAPLHVLIEEIRTSEIHLGCFLEVIHIPGLIMIQQGTVAYLSWGIWISSFQGLMDPTRITQAVFDPLPFDPELAQFCYVNLFPEMHHPIGTGAIATGGNHGTQPSFLIS
jgi:hypothetical protein